jgi:hypothetical protein
MDYDPKTRTAVFTYKSGRTTTVKEITEAKAKEMLERVMPEFERRDGCLTSVGGEFTRDDGHGG